MRSCSFLIGVLALVVSGCGNFLHTTVPTSGWKEIGINRIENPYCEPFRQYGGRYRYVTKTNGATLFQTIWDYEVETLAAGAGDKVKAGDLVKIRLRILESAGTKYSNEFHELMVYVGRTDFEDRRTAFSETPAFGFELGSIKIRHAIIGRNVGERIIIRRPTDIVDSQGDNAEFVPFKALLVKLNDWTMYTSKYVTEFAYPEAENPKYRKLPYIKLSGNDIKAEIEIVETCKARLSIREANVLQAGVVFKWGSNPDTFRSAKYQWAAVEATCSKTAGPIYIEAGPVFMGGQQVGKEAPTSPYIVPASDAEYESIDWENYRLRKAE